MIDIQFWRRFIVNEILPRRLKLTVVASGIINYPRYKKKTVEYALKNSEIDVSRVRECVKRGEHRKAWSIVYYPFVGEYVEPISEVEFYCTIEYSLNHILYCDLVGSQKDYQALGLDFPMLETVGFIRDGKLHATDGKDKNAQGNESAESVRIDPDIDYFIKPAGVDSGGGRAVTELSGRDLLNSLDTLSRKSKLLIVQPVFRDHAFFRSLNPTSLNTLRVMTLVEDGKARLLSAVQRVGRLGSITDNQVSGGVTIGVDEHGCLKSFAVGKTMQKVRQLPDSGLEFAGLQIPNYQSMIDLCLEIHSRLRNLGLISWDVTLSHDGKPVIVEMNCSNQGIGLHQFNNPGSLLPLAKYRKSWWERMAHVWSRYPTGSDLVQKKAE